MLKSINFKKLIIYSKESHFDHTIEFFAKTLYSFFLLKWIFYAPKFHLFFQGYMPDKPASLINIFEYSWVKENHYFFYYFLLFLVFIALFQQRSLLWPILVYWINLNIYNLIYPVKSGEEMVINLMLFANIFMHLQLPAKLWKDISSQVSNFFFVFARIQVGLIYFVSGCNKLFSSEWTSGEALHQVLKLEAYILPSLYNHSFSEGILVAASWSIILFELSFLILVFIKQTKTIILIIGIIFHISIGVFLSLPFFGLAMIATYTLFLKDDTAKKLLEFINKRLGALRIIR